MLALRLSERYGVLAEFDFQVLDGYQVLVGTNNSGKSTILQLAFREAYKDSTNYGSERIALLLSDREYISSTTETGGQNLANWNAQLMQYLQRAPMPYEGQTPPNRNELPKVLLNHTNFRSQLDLLERYLIGLGFYEPNLRGAQQMYFQDVLVQLQGSGLRSLIGILAALTDPRLKLICIDEPELSLEPSIQKALRDLLIEQATAGKTILVATQSHLLLNRKQVGFNYVVSRRPDGHTEVRLISSEEELFDVTFSLLGNDTEDLFFPGNYLIVEGSSDQTLCERALALRQTPRPRVKVLAAGGVTNVRNTIEAVVQSLRPLTTHDSPYARRVVALIDKPVSEKDAQREAEIRLTLEDRLFVLDQPSLEEYIPPELYIKAGRDKQADLEQLKTLSNDFKAFRAFKRQISTQIAQHLMLDDFEQLPIIRDAADRAINWAAPDQPLKPEAELPEQPAAARPAR